MIGLGVQEQIGAKGFFIFPNPANDKIFIHSKQKFKAVKIFDSTGRAICSEINDYSAGIDINAIAKGIYFMELINPESTERIMFVKN